MSKDKSDSNLSLVWIWLRYVLLMSWWKQTNFVFAFLCGQFRKKIKTKSHDAFFLIQAANQMEIKRLGRIRKNCSESITSQSLELKIKMLKAEAAVTVKNGWKVPAWQPTSPIVGRLKGQFSTENDGFNYCSYSDWCWLFCYCQFSGGRQFPPEQWEGGWWCNINPSLKETR